MKRQSVCSHLLCNSVFFPPKVLSSTAPGRCGRPRPEPARTRTEPRSPQTHWGGARRDPRFLAGVRSIAPARSATLCSAPGQGRDSRGGESHNTRTRRVRPGTLDSQGIRSLNPSEERTDAAATRPGRGGHAAASGGFVRPSLRGTARSRPRRGRRAARHSERHSSEPHSHARTPALCIRRRLGRSVPKPFPRTDKIPRVIDRETEARSGWICVKS